MKEIPVLICGAGPVGLSLSLALSRLGIKNLIIEKHAGTSIHPKARGVNVRTMELFRSWGVEDAIRQHELDEQAHRILWLESVQGNIIGEVPLREKLHSDSPTHACLVTQDLIEKELLNAVSNCELSGIKFLTELTACQQHDGFVACELVNRESQVTEQINAQYLIAADGAHSFIRGLLNIKMSGIASLGSYLSVFCRTDLTPWLNDKLAVVTTFTNEEQRRNFIMAVDLKQKWVVAKRIVEEEGRFSDKYCTQLVRDVAEDEGLSVDVINTSVWEMAALNAEQYRQDRVFLVGDAAHRLPPTGGMGMNTGIHDAHNLAWKLAFVIQGIADITLLDSYQAERQPIAEYTIQWSHSNAERIFEMIAALEANDLELFTQKIRLQQTQVDHLGLDLGFIYRSNAVSEDKSVDVVPDADHYHPSSAVGGRAPHCEIEIDKKQLSTLDLFEQQYVLLMAPKCRSENIRQQLLIPKAFPLKMLQIDRDFCDINNDFMSLYQLGPEGAVLVRPDGHVAWRIDCCEG